MTEQRVLTEIEGQIAYVWLNRPEKLNGVDLELIEELIAVAESLKANRDIRAVVIQGKGRSFCAGLDFGAAFKDRKRVARFFLAGPRAVNKFQKVTTIWRDVPVPVIAVVHGHCYGAGVQLAAGADFRFTTPDATWSILEAKWGLVPDMGGTVPFGDQMKADDVMRLSMTGEQITGARAAEIGLATEAVDEPIKAALDLIEAISERSPDSVAATKKLIYANRRGSLRQAWRLERKLQARMFKSANTKIAREAASAKQPASYKPRTFE